MMVSPILAAGSRHCVTPSTTTVAHSDLSKAKKKKDNNNNKNNKTPIFSLLSSAQNTENTNTNVNTQTDEDEDEDEEVSFFSEDGGGSLFICEVFVLRFL